MQPVVNILILALLALGVLYLWKRTRTMPSG